MEAGKRCFENTNEMRGTISQGLVKEESINPNVRYQQLKKEDAISLRYLIDTMQHVRLWIIAETHHTSHGEPQV